MASEKIPSPQDEEPETPIPVDRVGFTGLKVPAGRMRVGGLELILVPEFEVFIDLPPNRRGIHASRSYELVAEVVEEYAGKAMKLEEIAARVASRLLSRHPYSQRAYVKVRATTFYRAEAPVTRAPSYESFKILARAEAVRNNGWVRVRKYVGVEVWGLTACPCAREAVKALKPESEATHMQRSRARVIIELEGEDKVNVLELAEVVRSSFSSPLFSHLKRVDEAEVILGAVSSPRFVEDAVREIVKGVAGRWPRLAPSARIYAQVRSEESIHSQDIAAYIRSTIGEVRRWLGEGP